LNLHPSIAFFISRVLNNWGYIIFDICSTAATIYPYTFFLLLSSVYYNSKYLANICYISCPSAIIYPSASFRLLKRRGFSFILVILFTFMWKLAMSLSWNSPLLFSVKASTSCLKRRESPIFHSFNLLFRMVYTISIWSTFVSSSLNKSRTTLNPLVYFYLRDLFSSTLNIPLFWFLLV
jgi:hypothetical protein